MPQALTYSWAPLLGLDVITDSRSPLVGHCNVYSAALGPLAPVLRQASTGTLGTICHVEKDPNDISGNAVIFSCSPGETFFDGSTTRALTDSGSFLLLTLVVKGGVAKWKVVGSGNSGPSLGGQTLTIDGGSAGTDYTGSLALDGGGAGTVYDGLIIFDGGSARTISGQGLYVASDGSLHYAGPTSDTVLAPA